VWVPVQLSDSEGTSLCFRSACSDRERAQCVTVDSQCLYTVVAT